MIEEREKNLALLSQDFRGKNNTVFIIDNRFTASRLKLKA